MKLFFLPPPHMFVNFVFGPGQGLDGGRDAAKAFIEGARRLAQSPCYVRGGVGGAIEPQGGYLIRWAKLPIETARILACACGVLGILDEDGRKEVFGIPMTRMRDADTALDAIVRCKERYKLGRGVRSQYERTRRLELLRLLGLKKHGRKGTATRIHSEPPYWDGFGPASYAYVDVPDDVNKPITARANDSWQLSYILGGSELIRAAFGTLGSHLSFSRV